jgi:SAM-dependent methyltransferase
MTQADMHPIVKTQLEGQGLMLNGIDTVPVTTIDATKRGINLGCGRIILPCEQPDHHRLLPAELYEAGAYTWDNVDSVDNDGVNKVIDLFDYPWQHFEVAQKEYRGGISTYRHTVKIQPDSYDVAIATHLCEHIPHAVKRNGEVRETHGGWWAWWDELGRVLKPGGVAHILVPYGFSRGGLMDPTHTRYLLPETFGYFHRNPDAPFDYPLAYEWEALAPATVMFTPLAYQAAEIEHGEANPETLWRVAQKYMGAVSEFAISLRVKK